MAPEAPGNLVVIDLRFQNGELKGSVETVEYDPEHTAKIEEAGGWFSVLWNENPKGKDHIPVGGGVVHVKKNLPLGYRISPKSPVELDSLGNGRFAYRYPALGEGLMLVLILPEGHTLSLANSRPMPKSAKVFKKGRLAAYWKPEGKYGTNVKVTWEIKSFAGDLGAERDRINADIDKSEGVTDNWGVIVDPPAHKGQEEPVSTESPATASQSPANIIYANKLYEQAKDLIQDRENIDETAARKIIELIDDAIKEFGTTNHDKKAELRKLRPELEKILPPDTVEALRKRAEGHLLQVAYPKQKFLRNALLWIVGIAVIVTTPILALVEWHKNGPNPPEPIGKWQQVYPPDLAKFLGSLDLLDPDPLSPTARQQLASNRKEEGQDKWIAYISPYYSSTMPSRVSLPKTLDAWMGAYIIAEKGEYTITLFPEGRIVTIDKTLRFAQSPFPGEKRRLLLFVFPLNKQAGEELANLDFNQLIQQSY